MIWKPKAGLGPGELRHRRRMLHQAMYFVLAALLGAAIGLATGAFEAGEGSIFTGSWETLRLPPAMAIGIAVLLLAGFLVLPLAGFRMIDDYKREQNFIAFTGGCVAVLAGYPVWAVLHAGGFVPPPHAFGLFALAYAAMFISFLYARWRP